MASKEDVFIQNMVMRQWRPSDLLPLLQEAEQRRVVGPLLLLGPSGLQQLLLELLLALLVRPVCRGPRPLQGGLHQACGGTAGSLSGR